MDGPNGSPAFVGLLRALGAVQKGYELLPHAVWQFGKEPDQI